jgi:hypothetical protein
MAGVKQVAVTSARSGSDEADNTFLRKTGLVECPYDKSQKRAWRIRSEKNYGVKGWQQKCGLRT